METLRFIMLVACLICALTSYPKNLFQTTDKPLDVPDKVRVNMETKASGWHRKVLDDAACAKHLSIHFPRAVQPFYNIKRGEHKADLCRAALLYVFGGAYIDIKTILLDDLNSIAQRGNNASLITVLDDSKIAIYNGFLIATPAHPMFLDVVDYFISVNGNIARYNDVIQRMYVFMQKDKSSSYYLLTEKCGTAPIYTHGRVFKDLDRYCLNCMIYANAHIVIKTRYATYPWGASPHSRGDMKCVFKHYPILYWNIMFFIVLLFCVVAMRAVICRRWAVRDAHAYC